MGIIDFVLLAILVAGVVRGAYLGSIKMVASVLALVLAIIAANVLGDEATGLLRSLVPELASKEWLCGFLGHSILFVLVYLTVSLFGKLVRSIVQALSLGLVDRLLGVVFCTLKYMLIASLLLNVWHAVSPDSSLFASSRLFDGALLRFAMDLAPRIIDSPVIPAISDAVQSAVA